MKEYSMLRNCALKHGRLPFDHISPSLYQAEVQNKRASRVLNPSVRRGTKTRTQQQPRCLPLQAEGKLRWSKEIGTSLDVFSQVGNREKDDPDLYWQGNTTRETARDRANHNKPYDDDQVDKKVSEASVHIVSVYPAEAQETKQSRQDFQD
jgi:hypothetical protein